jgi:hypothetical protein
MTTQDDVRRLAMALPEVGEGADDFGFFVQHGAKQRGFCWAWRERVHPKKPKVPNPDVLVIRVDGSDEKEALLASDPEKFFTEPHYNGFPAVLVRLAAVDVDELRDLLTDAWACMAPAALVKAFVEQ